jgi:hypothetical protein
MVDYNKEDYTETDKKFDLVVGAFCKSSFFKDLSEKTMFVP